MSEEQKMIMEATTNMSVNQLKDILRYIKFIQYESESNDNAPEHLIVKNDEDFLEKIKAGMQENEEISFEDVIINMDKKVIMQRGN